MSARSHRAGVLGKGFSGAVAAETEEDVVVVTAGARLAVEIEVGSIEVGIECVEGGRGGRVWRDGGAASRSPRTISVAPKGLLLLLLAAEVEEAAALAAACVVSVGEGLRDEVPTVEAGRPKAADDVVFWPEDDAEDDDASPGEPTLAR